MLNFLENYFIEIKLQKRNISRNTQLGNRNFVTDNVLREFIEWWEIQITDPFGEISAIKLGYIVQN